MAIGIIGAVKAFFTAIGGLARAFEVSSLQRAGAARAEAAAHRKRDKVRKGAAKIDRAPAPKDAHKTIEDL